MSVRCILSTLSVAAVTLVVTLGTLVPVSVDAEAETNRIAPQISRPELLVDGCRFRVAMNKVDYAAGEKPLLRVTATNPTNETVETAVTLQIQATSPASAMSRIVMLPKPLWSEKWDLVLQAGEIRTVELQTEAALPAGQIVSINLAGGDASLIARQLNLPNLNGWQTLSQVTQEVPAELVR